MTEQEIADKLGVDGSTISRDIKTLKLLSQRFVFDLAKSDLAYYYKQCIDGIQRFHKCNSQRTGLQPVNALSHLVFVNLILQSQAYPTNYKGDAIYDLN